MRNRKIISVFVMILIFCQIIPILAYRSNTRSYSDIENIVDIEIYTKRYYDVNEYIVGVIAIKRMDRNILFEYAKNITVMLLKYAGYGIDKYVVIAKQTPSLVAGGFYLFNFSPLHIRVTNIVLKVISEFDYNGYIFVKTANITIDVLYLSSSLEKINTIYSEYKNRLLIEFEESPLKIDFSEYYTFLKYNWKVRMRAYIVGNYTNYSDVIVGLSKLGFNILYIDALPEFYERYAFRSLMDNDVALSLIVFTDMNYTKWTTNKSLISSLKMRFTLSQAILVFPFVDYETRKIEFMNQMGFGINIVKNNVSVSSKMHEYFLELATRNNISYARDVQMPFYITANYYIESYDYQGFILDNTSILRGVILYTDIPHA
ncbi:MAG: hypothetical protein Q6363_007360, partial [Candidatus Njordarchaeota archaeon]